MNDIRIPLLFALAVLASPSSPADDGVLALTLGADTVAEGTVVRIIASFPSGIQGEAVTFYDNGNLIGVAPMHMGNSSYSLQARSVGVHRISINYRSQKADAALEVVPGSKTETYILGISRH